MANTQLGRDGNGQHAGVKEPAGASSRRPAAGSSKESAGSKHGRARVQHVLDRFARALTAGDGDAVADLWETPAFVIGAGMARAVSAREEVVAFFSGAKDQYDSGGIADTRAEIQRLDWVSKDLVVVDVRWPYISINGDEVGEETSTYTLMGGSGGELKIRSVLMRGAAE
jgi:hypothetical protein